MTIAIVAILISIVAAAICAMIIRKDSVRKYFSEKMHFSPSKTVLADTMSFQGNGSTMRVYLKNVDYYVEGAVYAFNNIKDDQWVALCYYTKYDIDTKEIKEEQQQDPNQYFLFNLENVITMEIWPTVSDEE